jgi:hypothetical protein
MLSIPPHVRSVQNADGVVLLNVQSGAYFALNGVGSLVWERLCTDGTREAAIEALEGRYRAPRERLAHDVDTLLGRLLERGLITRGGAPSAGLAAPEAAAPRTIVSPATGAPTVRTLESDRIPARPERFALGWRGLWFLLACASLIGADVLLRLRGFDHFHRVIRRWPTRSARVTDAADVARIRAAVDQASGFYFKRAWCLQRSAATACLLRLWGFPARLIIGVRRMPFAAHAWVELDGRIINDEPRVCSAFEVIERC